MTEAHIVIDESKFSTLWSSIITNEEMARAHQFFDEITIKKIRFDDRKISFKKRAEKIQIKEKTNKRNKLISHFSKSYADLISNLQDMENYVCAAEKQGTNETKNIVYKMLAHSQDIERTLIFHFWVCVRNKHFSGKDFKIWINEERKYIDSVFLDSLGSN
ncbi:hypothetical protein [Acetobacter malorum]|uniref:Uncharacterized protein n=1 Tax=Acetobacter malorum TaxID=178901 RepID=A0A1Y3G8H1_9PROT|nr:hypothetical protein [Acetobacter malorum]OUJ07275.1 hypothetical protein HK23_11980 [Acetobacter malorum]